MWNLHDIKQKKKYVVERLIYCLDESQREKFFLTFRNYISMLEESGTFRYTVFYNFLDKITQDHFSFYYYMWQFKKEELSSLSPNSYFMDENYLSFLLQIAYRVAHTDSLEKYDILFRTNDYSLDFIQYVVQLFYSSLEDEEISRYAKYIIEKDDTFQVAKFTRYGLDNNLGTTFDDFIFHKSYSLIHKQNNIFDLQIYMHELLHQIDFYMQPKNPFSHYFGFHEIPTYALEYRFLTFLDEFGFAKDEVQKLRVQKELYLQRLSISTLRKISVFLSYQKKLGGSSLPSIQEVGEILDISLLRDLLEIEAGVIASKLGYELMDATSLGLFKLKSFMKLLLPIDERPDFSFLGFDDQTILDSSYKIGSFSKRYMKKEKF